MGPIFCQLFIRIPAIFVVTIGGGPPTVSRNSLFFPLQRPGRFSHMRVHTAIKRNIKKIYIYKYATVCMCSRGKYIIIIIGWSCRFPGAYDCTIRNDVRNNTILRDTRKNHRHRRNTSPTVYGSLNRSLNHRR